MNYNDHFEELKQRMLRYWNREDTDRACAAIMLRRPGWQFLPRPGNFYFEIEQANTVCRNHFAGTEYIWEAIPAYMPYFGTAGIAEYIGCQPTYTPRTVWLAPCLDQPDASRISFACPQAFDRQVQAIRKLVGLAQHDYAVTVTDNCGIADALAAIRGNENFLFDLINEPDFVTAALQKLLPIYKQTQNELFELVKDNNEGSIHSWMHLWAPKRCAQMQCDLSAMISPAMYEQFIVPVLQELCDFLDYPVYHFDGQEQIRHLDLLLSVKKLRAIQWTHVAGQPKVSNFIKELQRIQKAGKNLVLMPDFDEVQTLLDNLSCRGLQMILYVRDAAQADTLMNIIKTHSKLRD